jgi:hypothetical protein
VEVRSAVTTGRFSFFGKPLLACLPGLDAGSAAAEFAEELKNDGYNGRSEERS